MEITGKLSKVLDVITGQKKDGSGVWQKIGFVVTTEDQFNNLYYFEILGAEKVENFKKYNKVGDEVKVSFNVQTNGWEGKYFTSLQAWRVDTIKNDQPGQEASRANQF